MIIEGLREQLQRVAAFDQREAESIARTLDRLSWPGDPFSEHEHDHHVTSSAFVISSRGVILHRHRRLGIWVQPGGHVDPGESPESACVRETAEETGLAARHLEPATLLHVDVHPGPKGHTHYDLRYVLLSEPLDPRPAEGESAEVYWFDLERAIERAERTDGAGLRKLSRSLDGLGVPDLRDG